MLNIFQNIFFLLKVGRLIEQSTRCYLDGDRKFSMVKA